MLAWLWEETAVDSEVNFGSSIDVRNQDAVGSGVQGLLDAVSVIVSSDSDETLSLTLVDGRDLVGQTLVVERSMLGVNQEPVISGLTELFSNDGAVRIQE